MILTIHIFTYKGGGGLKSSKSYSGVPQNVKPILRRRYAVPLCYRRAGELEVPTLLAVDAVLGGNELTVRQRRYRRRDADGRFVFRRVDMMCSVVVISSRGTRPRRNERDQ